MPALTMPYKIWTQRSENFLSFLLQSYQHTVRCCAIFWPFLFYFKLLHVY